MSSSKRSPVSPCSCIKVSSSTNINSSQSSVINLLPSSDKKFLTTEYSKLILPIVSVSSLSWLPKPISIWIAPDSASGNWILGIENPSYALRSVTTKCSA